MASRPTSPNLRGVSPDTDEGLDAIRTGSRNASHAAEAIPFQAITRPPIRQVEAVMHERTEKPMLRSSEESTWA